MAATCEPLPVYTPRRPSHDNETSSIRSAAPSYHSTLPVHHSSILSTPIPTPQTSRPPRNSTSSQSHPHRTGLPPIPPLPHTSRASSLSLHSYSQPWTTFSPSQSRHYASVAARRHERALSESSSSSSCSSSQSLASLPTPITLPAIDDPPLLPQEDPHLVGEIAAAEARNRRLLMSRAAGEEVLRREDTKWDFLLGQMADWDERERSWGVFRGRTEMRQKRREGGWRGRVGL